MIYVKTVYSRRDPISIGMQTAFLPVHDLTDAMANALRRIDANERRARFAAATSAPGLGSLAAMPVAATA